MTETAVKNQICQHCGADVRPDTQFCYNCGGSLAAETADDLKANPQMNVESSNGYESKPTTKLKSLEVADAPISKPIIEEETKLKSAATMRRKSKILQPKQTEVIWEEHENAPNVWFILAALFLTLSAIVIFYIASYLK